MKTTLSRLLGSLLLLSGLASCVTPPRAVDPDASAETLAENPDRADPENFEITVGLVAGPSLGVGGTISQVMYEGKRRWRLEGGLATAGLDEDLDNTGRAVDEGWDQATLGVRVEAIDEGTSHWSLRGGVAWVRAQGDPVFLDEPADYGGVYVGGAWQWELSEHVSTGPELTVFGLLPEGSGRTGGLVPQLAWRLIVHF